MQCPQCQHTNPDRAKFCNVCGAHLTTHCHSCGHTNPPGAKFCNACGTSLTATASVPRPTLLPQRGTEAELRFQALLPAVIGLLRGERRVTYRMLTYVFGLDATLLDDIRRELALRRLAMDEEGEVLVWTGETQVAAPPGWDVPRQPAALPSLPARLTETSTSFHGPTAGPETVSTDASHEVSGSSVEPVRATPEAERRQLTVMFCDLPDSTKLSQQLDAEDLREVIRAYQATAAAVIQQYEGHIAQYLGDGLLVYFGWPVAHEDDAPRAVHAGLGIVEAITTTLNPHLQREKGVQIAVRIGIHTGPVVVGEMGGGGRHEHLATGDTVNIASRLEGVAQPNTVVLSSVTARLVERSFALEDVGPHELKGVAEPMQVFRVLGPLERHEDETAAVGIPFLVGRDEEVGLLRRRWEQAKEGLGQVVLLSGEAGIGKSGLVEVLRAQVHQEGMPRIAFRCSSYHNNSALYPVMTHVERVLDVQRAAPPATKLDKLEQRLRTTSLPLPEVVPLLAGLLSVPLEGRYPPPTLTPQQQKQHTLDALVAWMVEEAERQPVLVAWEDLHWADPSTLELLGVVLEQTPTVPMLHVLTYRPEFAPPWPSRSHLTPITLNRLERPQVEALITHLAGGKALPAEVVAHIVAKTDGVPLYVEELTKMLLDSELLREETEQYVLTGPLVSVAIPDTLQDSLMARLDQLQQAKEVAQLGAVLGREFSYEMLQAIFSQNETTLQASLAQLVEAELLYQRGRPPRARYVFKHARIQDAAYASLLRSTQQQMHAQIAYALQAQPTEVTGTQPEILAHHFTEAGLAEPAIHYWYAAGQQASQHSASMEAIAHDRRGLELLERHPQIPDQPQRELDLHIALGQEWVTAKGYAAPEVEAAFSRARVLCQQAGMTSQLFLVLCGLCGFYNVSGKLHKSRELAEQLLQLAEQDSDLSSLIVAHETLGHSLLYLGEFARALTHEEHAIALSLSPQSRSLIIKPMGHDPSVACHCFAAFCRWCLGYPDQAVRKSQEALRLAEQLDHPFSRAFALYYAAFIRRFRREWQATLDHTEPLLTLAAEHGFTHWRLRGLLLHGWALAEGGYVEAGIAQMEQTLDEVRARGLGVRIWMRAYLAEAYGKFGQPEKGLAILREASTLPADIEERRDEAKLKRLEGDLLLSHSLDHQTEAEGYLVQALRCAQSQQAKSLELRAAMSLSRLWQRQRKADQARSLLKGVYGWFTEGFDTADLQEAKSLLETFNA